MALLALLVAGAAAAQTNTAEILGIVVDDSGAVLPGSRVVAAHPASGAVVERITDGEGRFFLPGLATGEWTVTAELPDFQRSTQSGIRWEIFNVLNRANFDVPNRIFGTPTSAASSGALNAREMQFGLRYRF